MRIGIDARKLHDGGIGTYIRGLLRAYAADPCGDEHVAFIAPEHQDGLPAGVEAIPVRVGTYSFAEHLVIARSARAAGVDLLHAPHYTLPLGWTGPSVVTIHDLIHVRHARWFRPGTGIAARILAGAAARRARRVLTGSSHARAEIVALLGIAPETIRVTPYGVACGIGPRQSEAVRAFRDERGLPPNYVLYVGARKRHKNLDVLLRALARLDPPASLVLSGPPWREGDRLARVADQAHVAERVHFAGPLASEEELSLLYSGASVYAQPSLDEGFGLPPLEAMACAVPVVASPAGALGETLGDAAVLASPEDPEAWSEAIGGLLHDPLRRAELGRRGLERARLFTWERTAALTRQAYREAIGDA